MKRPHLPVDGAVLLLAALLGCSREDRDVSPERADTAVQNAAPAKDTAVASGRDSIVPPIITDALSREDTVEWQNAVVPPVAPDTVPQWVWAARNRGHRELSCTNTDYVRNIVTIAFRPGTPLKQKISAIRLVRGRVVGGSELVKTDGFYYVEINPGKDGEGLCKAIYILSPLPQTFMVMPLDFNWKPL